MSVRLAWEAAQARLHKYLRRVVEQRWINVGLRTKMSLIVAIGLIGLLSIFALLGISTARQTAHQIINERVMLARMSAASLDSTLRRSADLLGLMSHQLALHSQPGEMDAGFEAHFQASQILEGIYLFDAQARLLKRAGGPGQEIAWEAVPGVWSALQGRPYSLSVLPGSRPLAVVTVPVVDSGGKPYQALAGLLDLTNPLVFPAERPFELGKTGVLDVVDARGTVLISTRPERILTSSEHPEMLQRLFVADAPGVETCLGCDSAESGEAWDETVAFAPLGEAPWGVVVRQQTEEVLAPVRLLTLVTICLGLVAIAGALTLVWLTTSSVIRPMQVLNEAAVRIAKGDLETPVEVTFGSLFTGRPSRKDEIGVLAQSFMIMRQKLKQSIEEAQAWNRELDARVRERTQAALNAQMEAQAARDDLRAIIDALSDELVVIDVDDRRVLQVNRAALRNLHQAEDALGRTCHEIFHCDAPCLPPDCICPIPGVLDTRAPVKVTHVQACKGNGGQKYLDIIASPLVDAGGRISRVVELKRDVTPERATKESLVRRNQQLSILNSVAMTVNRSLDLDELLGKALDEVLNLTGIEVGAVFLLEDRLGNLNLKAYRGMSEETARLAAQMGMLDGSCGGVIERGQVVVVPDLSHYHGRRARSLRAEKLRTLIHVPLSAKGCVFGSMCVGTRQKREFDPEEQDLLTAIGNQIGVAIENARLYADVQHKEHVRGELFKKAINAQEDERKRIARELHDDTSQALTALIFGAEEGLEIENLAEVRAHLAGMRDLAQHTLDGVHKLVFDLRPSMLDHLGLVPALHWFATSRLEPKGMRVVIEEQAVRRLPAEVETALFRVVQEAVVNIARHSAARNVSIIFDFSGDEARIHIQDDGIGFNLNEIRISPETGSGYGLIGMQERLELLNGELELNTEPGQGTDLFIRAPLAE